MSATPDYAAVQAALTANLLRHGVLDDRIARDQMEEWARIISDLAAAPVIAERDALAAQIEHLKEVGANLMATPEGRLAVYAIDVHLARHVAGPAGEEARAVLGVEQGKSP